MAYSLNDVYRYLRIAMRIDAIVVGLSLGLLLAVFPRSALTNWGVYAEGPVWPIRMAGGLLLTLGVLLFLSAQERTISAPVMVAMTMGNTLIAFTLLVAYLKHELAMLNLLGQLLLIVMFIVCLVSALVPLNYLRADYQAP